MCGLRGGGVALSVGRGGGQERESDGGEEGELGVHGECVGDRAELGTGVWIGNEWTTDDGDSRAQEVVDERKGELGTRSVVQRAIYLPLLLAAVPSTRVGPGEGHRSTRAHDPSIDSDRCSGLAPLGPRLAFFGQRRETAVDCVLCQPGLYVSTQQTGSTVVFCVDLDGSERLHLGDAGTVLLGLGSNMHGKQYSSNIIRGGRTVGWKAGKRRRTEG